MAMVMALRLAVCLYPQPHRRGATAVRIALRRARFGWDWCAVAGAAIRSLAAALREECVSGTSSGAVDVPGWTNSR